MNTVNNALELGRQWHGLFSLRAEDLYPGRYTLPYCVELAEESIEIRRLAKEKGSTIVAHNYLYPEFHETADKVGDSLGLSLYVRDACATRVDFESVFFMGATAKIICGDKTRVFVPDKPSVIGCSLVFGTDYAWLEEWKRKNPDGILVTYINSDAYVKSLSDYISTSRNTHLIIAQAAKKFPGQKILVLPDKFLGYVMKAKALDLLREEGIEIDPDIIEIYEHHYNGYAACCYVHQKIGHDAIEVAMVEHPDAEILIHPECGCANTCMLDLRNGKIPHEKAYILSTEGMVERARISPASEFIVATEMGMIYRLRKECPEKKFFPVSYQAKCDFMKACTLEKLRDSLVRERIEVVLCNDCCNPREPYEDDSVVHIQRSVANQARLGIERMLSIG